MKNYSNLHVAQVPTSEAITGKELVYSIKAPLEEETQDPAEKPPIQILHSPPTENSGAAAQPSSVPSELGGASEAEAVTRKGPRASAVESCSEPSADAANVVAPTDTADPDSLQTSLLATPHDSSSVAGNVQQQDGDMEHAPTSTNAGMILFPTSCYLCIRLVWPDFCTLLPWI